MTPNDYERDPLLRGYFYSLPAAVQNYILSSGIEISTPGELIQCAEHWMQNHLM